MPDPPPSLLDGEMMEESAAPVVPAQHRTDDPPLLIGHEAQPGVPGEKVLHIPGLVGPAQPDSLGPLPQRAGGIVVGHRELSYQHSHAIGVAGGRRCVKLEAPLGQRREARRSPRLPAPYGYCR